MIIVHIVYNRATHRHNFANNIGGGGLSTTGNRNFNLWGERLVGFTFLHLHHPNNHFENIRIFYLPVFNSVAKKLFLGQKNIGGAFASPPYTHEFMPLGPVLFQTVEKYAEGTEFIVPAKSTLQVQLQICKVCSQTGD